MATIQKYITNTNETRWRVRWRDNGKQKSKTFDRQRLARDFLIKIENDMREGSYISPSRILVSEYLDQWLEEHRDNLAPRSATNYRYLLDKVNRTHLGKIQMQQLKPADIQRMYTSFMREGYSGTSALNIHRILSKAFKDAVRQRLVAINPFTMIDAPKKNKFKGTIVTPEQIPGFLALFQDTLLYPAVCIALFCGLRRSEVLALRWKDIDFKKKVLHVKHSIYWQDGEYYLQPPKSKQSREVPMTDGIITVLKKQRKHQQDMMELLWHNYQRSDFVITYDDGKPVRPHVMSDRYKVVIRDTEYKNIRYHDLRHTAASLMLLEDNNLKTVSEILGHSTITITADTYLHVINEMKRKAVTSLDKYMPRQG